MRPSLSAEVVGTAVEAQYQGNVYERTVRIIIDGTVVEVFDGRNVVTDADRGAVVDMILCGRLIRDIELVEDAKLGIDQAPDRESKWSAEIGFQIIDTGTHSAVGDSDSRVVLADVGYGLILLEPASKLLDPLDRDRVSNDTSIRVRCGRLDIVGRR